MIFFQKLICVKFGKIWLIYALIGILWTRDHVDLPCSLKIEIKIKIKLNKFKEKYKGIFNIFLINLVSIVNLIKLGANRVYTVSFKKSRHRTDLCFQLYKKLKFLKINSFVVQIRQRQSKLFDVLNCEKVKIKLSLFYFAILETLDFLTGTSHKRLTYILYLYGLNNSIIKCILAFFDQKRKPIVNFDKA
ncbi:hypothetical protein BpHYR1_019626 [Brachionus plicatilis]|uniref:Uncharacterized protein n=1 Tax=Brachionus plicatilis TaxID=10195 RepID=A0A3M7QE33_BRAPC|nr:hypothetical protein BpHYR1_019626 [Brachionus plicatilis]